MANFISIIQSNLKKLYTPTEKKYTEGLGSSVLNTQHHHLEIWLALHRSIILLLIPT
jgi:hypothetical protein